MTYYQGRIAWEIRGIVSRAGKGYQERARQKNRILFDLTMEHILLTCRIRREKLERVYYGTPNSFPYSPIRPPT